MNVKVLVLLLAVAALAGCAWDRPPSTAPTTTRGVPKDANLRPVTMTYKDGLVYTYGETSAQALCHALSPQEWRTLLGGEVGRTIENYDECVVDNGSLTVRMSMELDEPDYAPDGRETELIGGYRAWTERGEAVVTLVEEPGSIWARPFLVVDLLTGSGGPDQRDLLRRLVTTLLGRLAHDGPATPVAGADDTLAFVPTQPVPGVRLIDLPWPVQALVLCTAMVGTGAPQVSGVDMAGQCAADDRDRRAAVTGEDQGVESARFKVGGRLAWFTDHDAIAIDLAKLSPDGYGRESHLYLKLEWLFADHTATKAWANQFVGQLGEL